MFSPNLHLPGNPDIACVSRYVMAQWNSFAPHSRVALAPPLVSDAFYFENTDRDIDVIVHIRKQSEYCSSELIPKLKSSGLSICVIDDWIDQGTLAGLLRRSKIFLYHTNLFVQKGLRHPLGEGFGLPPVEALMCGARVASDMIGGVNDFLDQANSIKILGKSPSDDCEAIIREVRQYKPNEPIASAIRAQYSIKSALEVWEKLLLTWYVM